MAHGFDVVGPIKSPYARFNLRRNPFGELTQEERAELAVVDAQPWLDALQSASVALQFMGEKGEGKTTHMLAIQRCMPNATYVYLPEDGPQPHIPNVRPLLIDEAQRLRPRQRRRVFALGGPLVLGTHQDFSMELQLAGLKVLAVDVSADRSPKRLARILNERIEASRLSRSPVPRIEVQHARLLLHDARRSIREIVQSLYDEFQKAVQTGLPWPPAT